MSKIPRIKTAEPIIHGVLKIVWDDGYEGVVDLRPVIARGNVFTYLQKPENFLHVAVGDYGHHLFWRDEEGEEIDLGSDSLRERAERQTEMHQLAG